MGKEFIFSINGTETTRYPLVKKRKVKTLPHIIYKNHLKDLHLRPKSIKLLEENMKVNLCDLGFSESFYVSEVQETTEKINWTLS